MQIRFLYSFALWENLICNHQETLCDASHISKKKNIKEESIVCFTISVQS